MGIDKLPEILAARWEGDHSRIARMQHFVALLKAGMEGLAQVGVVVYVDVPEIEETEEPPPAKPDLFESMDAAVKFMQEASKNATN